MAEYDLKRMQELQLQLFDEFRRICDLHGIQYYLAFGTCLGAVRHKGFIPWDDDIDVFVFSRDMERLRQAMAADLSEGFFYQCEQTEPDFHMTITRLRLDGTTMIDMDSIDHDIHQGVFIDIYPVHELSHSALGRKRQQAWAMVNCLLTIHRIPRNHGLKGKVAAAIGFALLDHKGVKEHARKVMCAHAGEKTGYVTSLSSGWIDIGEVYSQESFVPMMAEFEGRMVPIPSGYDELLTLHYGDYMTLPPEDKRHGYHTTVLFEPDTPYQQYRGTKYYVKSNKAK